MANSPRALVKKWNIDNHTSGGLNGPEFEKELPYNMRFKEFDYDNPEGVLRWQTQEPYSDEDIETFKTAMRNHGINKAHVILRDDHTGDWHKNLAEAKGHVIDLEDDDWNNTIKTLSETYPDKIDTINRLKGYGSEQRRAFMDILGILGGKK